MTFFTQPWNTISALLTKRYDRVIQSVNSFVDDM